MNHNIPHCGLSFARYDSMRKFNEEDKVEFAVEEARCFSRRSAETQMFVFIPNSISCVAVVDLVSVQSGSTGIPVRSLRPHICASE